VLRHRNGKRASQYFALMAWRALTASCGLICGQWRRIRAGDLSADGAGCDFYLGVVAEALALAQFAVRHEKEFVIVFGEPDGCVDRDAALTKRSQTDVALTVNLGGDGLHVAIVKCWAGDFRAVGKRKAAFTSSSWQPSTGQSAHSHTIERAIEAANMNEKR